MEREDDSRQKTSTRLCKPEVIADSVTQRKLKTKHEEGEVIKKQTNFHLRTLENL